MPHTQVGRQHAKVKNFHVILLDNDSQYGFTKDSIDAINLLSFNRSNIAIYSQLALSD